MQRNWNENFSKNRISKALSKPKSNSHCLLIYILVMKIFSHHPEPIGATALRLRLKVNGIPTQQNAILQARVEPPYIAEN